ncbi:MAG: hypothetical protein QNK23_11985 [Crocinitomicaceae bacterium]|nr:hypothetical protein [Crocinitomicaceae bacterium]
MESKIEILSRRLIRSMESIHDFAAGHLMFDNGKNFFELHDFNKAGLEEMSKLSRNPYYKEKLAEYPKMRAATIDVLINDRKRGEANTGIENKLHSIAKTNQNIIHVLKHPGMDEMIKDAKRFK